ncbi:MAG: EamA family transporter [Candidatus Micrarchaeaceae archaeon]
MELKLLANTYLVLALLTGALMPVMLYFGADGISIPEFLFIVYAISVPASFAFVLLNGKKEKLFEIFRKKRDLALIALIGLLNYVFLEYGLTYAEKFVSASLATVIYRSFPILMFIFLPFILREKVSVKQIAALGLTFAGFALAFTGGNLSLSGSNFYIILFLVIVALASALATTLVKRYVFDMESSMFLFNLASFLFFAVFLLFQLHVTGIRAPGAVSWIAIIYTGIIYNVFTGFMYYSALRMIKTTIVTNFYFLSPFITFVFAYLLLGEAIKLYYLLIAVFVAAGLLIQRVDLEGGRYLNKKKEKRNYLIYDITSAFVNTKNQALYNMLKGEGRVLAVKVESDWYSRLGNLIEEAKGTDYSKKLIICSDEDMENVGREEKKFIRDIMGVKEGEAALISAGLPEHIESFFADFVERYKQG